MERREIGTLPIMEKVLDMVPIGVVVVNAAGRIVYLNDAYERILGVPRYKVLGRLMKDIEPGATLLDVLESGHEIRERTVRIRSINRQVKVNILPLRTDSTLFGAVSFFEDVTESSELSHELVRVKELADHFREELETQRELPRSFGEIEGRDPGFMKVLGQAAIVADTDGAGTASRRERNRQGGYGQSHPRGQSPGRQAVYRRELRGGSGQSA